MLPSGLPEVVDDDEDLARFLWSSGDYSSKGVKRAPFMPRAGETSVFRHVSEPREQLWQIATTYIPGDRKLHGAAIVKTRHIRDVRLDVIASEPPPRHANIVGWAWSAADPEFGKAERMEQVLRIAEHAELVLR